MTSSAPWAGVLTLAAGAVGFQGVGGDAERHAHHAIQLMLSCDAPFVITTSVGATPRQLALVPSGVSHHLSCKSERVLLLLVDPNGPRGRALNALADGEPDEVERFLLPALQASSSDSLAEILNRLDQVVESPPRASALSIPVRTALQHLEHGAPRQPRLADVAAAAHVSPSHLTHLFTREVGLPFRRYSVWVRLRHAVEAVAGGANLTDAAADAGFSDSAHLSRMFKANFGLPPSALLTMCIDADAWPTKP